MIRYFTHSLKPKFWLSINILIATCLVCACSSSSYRAPVENAKDIPSYKIQSHRVVKGDTVYSIAWRYGLDYKLLARANRLDRNFSIWPGQLLTLDVSRAPPEPAIVKKSAPKNTAPSAKNVPKKPVAVPVPRPKPAVPSVAVTPSVKPEQSSKNQAKKSQNTPKNQKTAGGIRWSWPIRGKVIVKFDQKQGLNKGIDIAAKLGESVNSAASGEVVYAGSGLRGYGKLVIVKHSEKFLSADAHNRKLLVKEGERVAAGHKIAEVGLGASTNRAQLHFEIRYDGVPVDPLKYLPRL